MFCRTCGRRAVKGGAAGTRLDPFYCTGCSMTPGRCRCDPRPDASLPAGELAREVDRHWLNAPSRSARGEIEATCTCGEWRWVAAGPPPRIGDHFLPFSEHVATVVLAALAEPYRSTR